MNHACAFEPKTPRSSGVKEIRQEFEMSLVLHHFSQALVSVVILFIILIINLNELLYVGLGYFNCFISIIKKKKKKDNL